MLSLAMIPITVVALYVMVILPERRLQFWAKKRGFTIVISDDESITKRTTYYSPKTFRVRVRDADGVLKSGTVRVYDDYAVESWEVDKFSIFRF